MLGTLRRDGWTRISPTEYVFFEGELVLGGMWQAKKALDLLRDSRCTLHSVTTDKDGQQGDVKLYGRALPVEDPAWLARYWDHIFALQNFRPNGPAHVFTIDVESAGYIVFSGDGMMRWLTWPGNQWRSGKSS